jgi:hypothetical protein
MNTRLMNYWTTLREGEPYALITKFNVEAVPGFGPHAFMLDLSHDLEDPLVRYLGQKLSAECGKNVTGRKLSEVPPDSLLARVAQHYRRVLGNKKPSELEAEYTDDANRTTLYRGIMLPFTVDGKNIDYIVGAVTSKTLEAAQPPAAASDPVENDTLESGPAQSQDARGLLTLVEAEVAPKGPQPRNLDSLNRSLQECQALVRRIDAAESRSHKALYAALERVYAFHFQADADSEALERLLADAGLKVQERAPFIPVVKLVFGAGYEKTRLSEYAAALSYAKRCGQKPINFRNFIESQQGGLKGCVRAERAARRAARNDRPDPTEQAKALLRTIESRGLITDLEGGADDFVLILGRRSASQSGVIEVVRILEENASVVDAALRRAARAIRREKRGRKRSSRSAESSPPQSAGEPSRPALENPGTALGHKQKLTN